jgi:hypothetical protein
LKSGCSSAFNLDEIRLAVAGTSDRLGVPFEKWNDQDRE